MSENERQSQTNAVIIDKLQGTVVTYLRCGGVVNNQIKSSFLFNLPEKKTLKSVNIWLNYGQKRGLCHALSSTFSSVVARRKKCTRQPPLLLVTLPNIHRF